MGKRARIQFRELIDRLVLKALYCAVEECVIYHLRPALLRCMGNVLPSGLAFWEWVH